MALPTFIVIGAAKAGTTTLYRALQHHAGVTMSSLKEPNYFAHGQIDSSFAGPRDDVVTSNAVRSMGAYRSLFPDAERVSARGEASALYLYVPHAAAAISAVIPDARLVVSLRHPVDRLNSHYWDMRSGGRETLPTLREAVEAEDERVRANWEWGWHYRRMGYYHEQLLRYLKCFERHQLHIVLFDDLIQGPVEVIRGVFRFIGVDDSVRFPRPQKANASGKPRNRVLHRALTQRGLARRVMARALPFPAKRKLRTWLWSHSVRKPPVEGALRAELLSAFRDDTLKLQDLLERDLSAWLR